MKNLLSLSVLLVLGACKVFEVPENPVDTANKTMDQLQIPSSFTFSTTQDINVNITSSDNSGTLLENVPFKLFTIDKDSQDTLLLFSGQTNTEGVFNATLKASRNIDKMVVKTDYIGLPSESTIDVTTREVNFNLSNDNLVRSELMGESKGLGGGGTALDATFSYMGNINAMGLPLYMLPRGQAIGQDILKMINNALGASVTKNYPEYIQPGVQSNIVLKESADLWVTFVSEYADYKNSLGYYTYPTNKPPTSAKEIAELKIVFPNTSFAGSGGSQKTGDKVYLGKFPAGTTVGWFIVPDGWDKPARTVIEKAGKPIHYSDNAFNTFAPVNYRHHSVLLADTLKQLFLLGFDDLNRPYTDDVFNNSVFIINAQPFTAVDRVSMARVPGQQIIDSDKDGVPDAQDAAPNDPSYAYLSFGPALNQYGTLAFEDAFPYKGDYDMNDMIVDYNIEERLNVSNKVTQIRATFALRAMGASYRNGFGIELPISPSKIASATGMKLKENIVKLSSNGTEAGQKNTVIIAFDNGYNLINTAGGAFVNTQKEQSNKGNDTIKITINFSEPIDKALLGSAPYNPFIFINKERGKEIHLGGKTPTSLANLSYFKTGHDATDGISRFYQTTNLLPWAIHIPQSLNYPVEKVPINAAFLKFNEWAESGGTLFVDWYKTKADYQNKEKIY